MMDTSSSRATPISRTSRDSTRGLHEGSPAEPHENTTPGEDDDSGGPGEGVGASEKEDDGDGDGDDGGVSVDGSAEPPETTGSGDSSTKGNRGPENITREEHGDTTTGPRHLDRCPTHPPPGARCWGRSLRGTSR